VPIVDNAEVMSMAHLICGRWRGTFLPVAVVATVLLAAVVVLQAQDAYFVYLFAADDKGDPIRDLKPAEFGMMEDNHPGRIVSLERFSMPVKVTVLVDNGLANDNRVGDNMLVNLRNGLSKFFEALPSDIEVSLIATAPNPRWIVRPTTDRVLVQKGLGLVTPEAWPGRFADSLVEYAARLEVEFAGHSPERPLPYQPVLVSIGSTTADGSDVRRDPLVKAVETFRKHRVSTSFLMFTPGGASDLNDGGNVLIAKAAQEVTGGRYEALASAASTSLNRLMPDVGASIASRHIRQTSQYRVILERPDGVTGPAKNISFGITREGVRFQLSADGTLP
jgi:hypothetical protein